jgi:hypothetical protein
VGNPKFGITREVAGQNYPVKTNHLSYLLSFFPLVAWI